MADALKGAAGSVSSGAQQAGSAVTDTASSGAGKVSSAASGTTSGAQDWEAMTEDQKKQTYDALPEHKKEGTQGYYDWVMQGYQNKKENWMPWIEDVYLSWFTNDNKASYATKGALDQTKVTGIEQVDTVQDGVNNAVGQQFGKGGLLQPVGDAVSQEGVNRAERGGKTESGSYGGAVGDKASAAGGSVWNGAKSAGGYVGGMFGGKKEESASK